MKHRKRMLYPLWLAAGCCVLGVSLLSYLVPVRAAQEVPLSLEASFANHVQPVLQRSCARCHNADTALSGVRVDDLNATFEDRQVRRWEAIRRRVEDGSMPPKGMPQPTAAERDQVVTWITRGLAEARSRPAPRNGSVRRLTVAQYRNTLRDLLQLEDEFTEILPPDAVSRDGFVNNQETLQLSPLLLEAYLEIAEKALHRAIVDPQDKPVIQNFRMDFGAGINPSPLPGELVLGAQSLLLDNRDFVVTELTPVKPFAFQPFRMRTRYRFIEGYQGNDTVRGWREFDSIYHAVFACMRGTRGYPKGLPYSTVPEGLLLRPAIPTDELFGGDGTYGPKANFKISLRELPDTGRFRVTVTASKYADGLLLDRTDAPADESAAVAVLPDTTARRQSVTIPKAGIYQIDVFAAARALSSVAPDTSRLGEGLLGAWKLDGASAGVALQADAKYQPSPFGQSLSLDGRDDAAIIARTAEAPLRVGEGDFTVAAWIRPRQVRRSGILAMGGPGWAHGWYLELPDNRGVLKLETFGPDNQPSGSVASPAGMVRPNRWQHIAAVVRRGAAETVLYVNGYEVAKGRIGKTDLDNLRMPLFLGRIPGAHQFHGEIDEVSLYGRALEETELQALLQPGREFALPPPEKPQELRVFLGGREFSTTLEHPAFLAVRLEPGPLAVEAHYQGGKRLDRLVITPLPPTSPVTRRFLAFEKRNPRVGVHLGFRRDCGSTFAPVGAPQTVTSNEPQRFVFEGAIGNYPSPDVEKDNVNYLAGIREIAVRSEYADGRDMPRLVLRSVEFEGPFLEQWPPPSHRAIFPHPAPRHNLTIYARQVLRRFATRAWRRPLTPHEESALAAVFDRSFASRGATQTAFLPAMKDALQVVLTAPQFLFLTEMSASPRPEPLDAWELASKLSYFLWNGPPDQRILKLAQAGTLRQQLNSEVDRMIADPRFSRFLEEFTPQWLSLDKFAVLEPDRNRFPALTREARAELAKEPVRLLDYLIRENLPVRHLIASDFIVANEVVASYYGLGDKIESGFQFLPVRHGRRELGGLLAQAALMAGLSDGRESNPVKRGAWLARKIVAEPPDDPPPNVPALKEDAGEKLTLRERIEQHRNQPGCRQCHAKIDPWGIALEEFDAGGRLKTEPADARSILPDQTEVNGIDGLRRYLVEDRLDQVAFSVLLHLAAYANGRTLSYYEAGQLRQQSEKLRVSGYRMRDMIRQVVNSNLFLEK